MRLSAPLDDVFQGRSNVKVLRALDRLPPGLDVSVREIARRAGVSHPTASGVLEALRRQGIVRVRRTPWADQFQVNEQHAIWPRLRPLLRWDRVARADVVRSLSSELRERVPWVRSAYLFGSAARGDMEPDSDLDVALIVPREEVERTKSLSSDLRALVVDRFGNQINVVVGPEPIEELAKSRRSGSRLWRSILEDGVTIIPARER
jgi:predicted nucleotidyltransferase